MTDDDSNASSLWPAFFGLELPELASDKSKLDRRYVRWRFGRSRLERAVRAMVEDFWQKVAPYVDPNLPSSASRNFIAAFWELDIAQTLLAHSIPLMNKQKSKGPDITIATTPRIHVEATIAGPGDENQPDRVVTPPEGEASSVQHDQIILRLRNSIETKRVQRGKRVKEGSYLISNPFVLAINASEVPTARLEMFVPDVLRSVFPLGNAYVRVETETGRVTGGGHERREEIIKKSGGPVSTTVFEGAEYSWLSALVYSDWDEVNRRDLAGAGLTIIRNPNATNPIPDGLFQFGRHYAPSADGRWIPDYRSPIGSRLLFERELFERNPGCLPRPWRRR